MALQVFDGFDHYNNPVDFLSRSGFLQWQLPASFQPSISFVTGRQSFGKAVQAENGNGLPGHITRAVWGARNAEAFFGFGLLIPGGALGPASSVTIALQDNVAGSPQITVLFNANNFSVQIFRGSTSGASLCLSANNVWTPDVWNFIELHAKINSSTGIIEVRSNGATIATVSGVDTQATANAWFDSGDFDVFPTALVTGAFFWLDDLYYCDTTSGPGLSPYNTWLGNCGTKTLFPVGNNSVQFSPQPNTNANWQNVAETAMDSDITYNYGATVGQEDLLNFQALPAGTQSVLAVQVTGAYRKDDVGSRSVKQALKSGTTKVYGSTFPLPDSYAYFTDLYILDPDTSANWTVAAVNAASAGYTVAG